MQSHAQNSTEPEADQTYFEMFSLPRKLIIDTSALERDFYKLSRKLHPDRWYACTDEHLRNEIQEAFYQMQAAYSESVKQCWARLQGASVQQGPLTTPAPEPASVPKGLFAWLQKLFSFLHFTPNTSTSG